MEGSYVKLILVALILFVVVFHLLFGNHKIRILKYIPSMVLAIAIGAFYLKMIYVSEGLEEIIDIISMIILSIVLFISLLLAVITEIGNKKKGKIK